MRLISQNGPFPITIHFTRMSYQVIARKWRPQVFEEVTGQEIITQTLRNALEYDRLHHAYLFSGARGVGKTTTARILAKALNCHRTEGKPNLTRAARIDPTACRLVHRDLREPFDGRARDRRRIAYRDRRCSRDDHRAASTSTRHATGTRCLSLTRSTSFQNRRFNALLKTLEEPPENVVFMMATTELHKVPETILSRCQEFEFRTIPLQKIYDRLKLIADAEKIDISMKPLCENSLVPARDRCAMPSRILIR